FKPLPQLARHIRVIELLPRLGHTTPICCRLILLNLDDPSRKPYDALSYAWSHEERVEIFVDKIPHMVSTHLASILRNLCAQEGLTPTLWVDTLCINMQDIKERSQQTSFKKAIYSGAQQVV
ncbi:hypothetical protein EJ08DRAFT_556399, partial [Tothia fuscella]